MELTPVVLEYRKTVNGLQTTIWVKLNDLFAKAGRERLVDTAAKIRNWVHRSGNPMNKHLCNGMALMVSLGIKDAEPVWSNELFQTWVEVGDMKNGWLIDAYPEGVPGEIEDAIKPWITRGVVVMPLAEARKIYGAGERYDPNTFTWRDAALILLEGSSKEDSLDFVMAARGLSRNRAKEIMRRALAEKLAVVFIVGLAAALFSHCFVPLGVCGLLGMCAQDNKFQIIESASYVVPSYMTFKVFDRKMDFEQDIRNDRILRALSANEDITYGLHKAYLGCLYNSFDAIIDSMEENKGGKLNGEISSQLSFDRDCIVINVQDNGKTIEFASDGTPKLRDHNPIKQFGGRGKGNLLAREFLSKYGGSIGHYPLKVGTRTQIRSPRKILPPSLASLAISSFGVIMLAIILAPILMAGFVYVLSSLPSVPSLAVIGMALSIQRRGAQDLFFAEQPLKRQSKRDNDSDSYAGEADEEDCRRMCREKTREILKCNLENNHQRIIDIVIPYLENMCRDKDHHVCKEAEVVLTSIRQRLAKKAPDKQNEKSTSYDALKRKRLIDIASKIKKWVKQNGMDKCLCGGTAFMVSLGIEDTHLYWSDEIEQTWAESGYGKDVWIIDAYPEGLPEYLQDKVKPWLEDGVVVMPSSEGSEIYIKPVVYVPSGHVWRVGVSTVLEGTSLEEKDAFVLQARGIERGAALEYLRKAFAEKMGTAKVKASCNNENVGARVVLSEAREMLLEVSYQDMPYSVTLRLLERGSLEEYGGARLVRMEDGRLAIEVEDLLYEQSTPFHHEVGEFVAFIAEGISDFDAAHQKADSLAALTKISINKDLRPRPLTDDEGVVIAANKPELGSAETSPVALGLLKDAEEVLGLEDEIRDWELLYGDTLWLCVAPQEYITKGDFLYFFERDGRIIRKEKVPAGYRPIHRVPPGYLAVVQSESLYRIYTTGLYICTGIAIKGKRNGKTVLGLAHLLPTQMKHFASILKVISDHQVTDIQAIAFVDRNIPEVVRLKESFDEIKRQQGI
ncbi:MAG: hypothetical protein NTZ92_08385, partial [Candidatus Omnitrophica bacterium]|nr:hypothetical protein [Candidatus Omnitrophota bacterium]